MKITKSTFLRYPVGRKFRRITLSRTVKEIEANLCFAIFGKNLKIQNGRHFWGGENFLKLLAAIFGEGKIFENCQEYIAHITCGSKISTKSLYLARLRN